MPIGPLRSLFEHLPAAVMIVRGPTHRVDYLNLAARTRLDVDEATFGKPLLEAFPYAARSAEVLDQVHATGNVVEINAFGARAPHWPHERLFNVVAQPIREDGGAISGVLTHAVEITEQARACRDCSRACWATIFATP